MNADAPSWPPRAGEPLPRAAEAWSESQKWSEWILAERGHGAEFERVLRVSLDDVDALWNAIAERVLVRRVRDLGAHGVNCEVDSELAIAGRTANVRTVWNCAEPPAGPRLVSAYPSCRLERSWLSHIASSITTSSS
jgi:hypothetical protein